jgi:hypothetical protein
MIDCACSENMPRHPKRNQQFVGVQPWAPDLVTQSVEQRTLRHEISHNHKRHRRRKPNKRKKEIGIAARKHKNLAAEVKQHLALQLLNKKPLHGNFPPGLLVGPKEDLPLRPFANALDQLKVGVRHAEFSNVYKDRLNVGAGRVAAPFGHCFCPKPNQCSESRVIKSDSTYREYRRMAPSIRGLFAKAQLGMERN